MEEPVAVVVEELRMGCGETGLLGGVAGEAQGVVVVVVLEMRIGCGEKGLGEEVTKEEQRVVVVVVVVGGVVAVGGRVRTRG